MDSILVLVDSTSSAPATPDGPSGPKPCASSACDTRCSGYRRCSALWAALLHSLMHTLGLLGRVWILKDVHAVAYCQAGSVSELSMDWEAALGVLQGSHESVRAHAMPCHVVPPRMSMSYIL